MGETESAHMEVLEELALSEKGGRFPLYLVMILALLLRLQTGMRPPSASSNLKAYI